MLKKIEAKNKQNKKRPSVPKDAVTSAASSMAVWFLRENKEKGRPLKIPKLNVILYPDGREEKIE